MAGGLFITLPGMAMALCWRSSLSRLVQIWRLRPRLGRVSCSLQSLVATPELRKPFWRRVEWTWGRQQSPVLGGELAAPPVPPCYQPSFLPFSPLSLKPL